MGSLQMWKADHRCNRERPGFPGAMGYGLYVVSPARLGSFVTALDKTLPVLRGTPATRASGLHDFTVVATAMQRIAIATHLFIDYALNWAVGVEREILSSSSSMSTETSANSGVLR